MTNTKRTKNFQAVVYRYYQSHQRVFPWRQTHDPYAITVSEMMLQQTQTERVIPYYLKWLERFPTWTDLSSAPLQTVLQYWQGLGYNRRGLALHRTAQQIIRFYQGNLPTTQPELESLPGIGPYTAAAILVFAFGQSAILVETNIRTVYLHYFYKEVSPTQPVSDTKLRKLIASTIDQRDPRNWYYALMDYGAYLKKQGIQSHRRSAHYRPQSPFAGSNRQVRGALIRLLTGSTATTDQLAKQLNLSTTHVTTVLESLVREGFLVRDKHQRWRIRS